MVRWCVYQSSGTSWRLTSVTWSRALRVWPSMKMASGTQPEYQVRLLSSFSTINRKEEQRLLHDIICVYLPYDLEDREIPYWSPRGDLMGYSGSFNYRLHKNTTVHALSQVKQSNALQVCMRHCASLFQRLKVACTQWNLTRCCWRRLCWRLMGSFLLFVKMMVPPLPHRTLRMIQTSVMPPMLKVLKHNYNILW